MPQQVTATPAALDLLERLRAEHGDLIVHISGGCCDGSSPKCLRAADLPASAQAHRGAAVTAAPRDVHDQVAVLGPQALEQVERRGRRGDLLRHQKKPSGFWS